MKRITILFGLLCCAMFFRDQSCAAINKNAISDSLTVYANQFQRIGKVKVLRIRVDGKRADVFLNKNLSCLSLDKNKIDRLRKIAESGVFGIEEGRCYIYSDGYELSELEAMKLREELHYRLPAVHHPLVENHSKEYDSERGLDGFHIALYGSHGIYYNQTDERWTFQRARLLTTVEDLYTTSYTMPFLVPMLENAGAIVLQPRERDTQLNEVIVDDTEAEQSEGSMFRQSAQNQGFGKSAQPLTEGVNPFRQGTYSYSPAETDKDKAGRMIYRPEIAEGGDYAVYVSYQSLPQSTDAAEYTVMHNGIETKFKVNQKMGGGTWIYLGTFGFSDDPERNFVSLSNHSKANTVVTGDAVKFGGGMGNVARYAESEAIENIKSSDDISAVNGQRSEKNSASSREGEVSGFPRYIEGARYWMQYAGIPDSVYNYTNGKNDYIDDYASRGRWMNWLIGGSPAYPHGQGLGIPVHLGFCFHTDAGITPNDSTIGTLVIYMNRDNEKRQEYPTGVSRLAARNYADIVQTQIVEDIRETFAPEWQRRELMNSSYAEARNPMIPTLLLELLSHQNPADMKYGLDPRFRFIVSRAIYKGMLKYLHEQYGSRYVVQPLPVEHFAIMNSGSDTLSLRWEARTDSLEPTAKAEYFIVYTRREGYDWDNGTKVEKNHYDFIPDKDVHYDFRIAAGNRGGISLPSETLSARLSGSFGTSDDRDKGLVLIINGFDRVSAPDYIEKDSTLFCFTTEAVPYGKEVNYIGRQYDADRSHPWVSDDNGGFGASHMDHADCWYAGNSFDYPVQHGHALASLGMSYISASAGAISEIPQGVSMVDLILGKQKLTTTGTRKQRSDFPTFTPRLMQVLTEYNEHGGKILVSGAYIASDKAADKEFLSNTLHLKYVRTEASRSGKISISIPDGSSYGKQTAVLLTRPNTTTIHCENPDGIAPADKQTRVFARYKDSFVAAAVAAENADTERGKTLTFSFPLESLESFEEVYTKAVMWMTE